MQFENLTLWKSNTFWPFEYQTSLVSDPHFFVFMSYYLTATEPGQQEMLLLPKMLAHNDKILTFLPS